VNLHFEDDFIRTLAITDPSVAMVLAVMREAAAKDQGDLFWALASSGATVSGGGTFITARDVTDVLDLGVEGYNNLMASQSRPKESALQKSSRTRFSVQSSDKTRVTLTVEASDAEGETLSNTRAYAITMNRKASARDSTGSTPAQDVFVATEIRQVEKASNE
jgi:hypothetical protein